MARAVELDRPRVAEEQQVEAERAEAEEEQASGDEGCESLSAYTLVVS